MIPSNTQPEPSGASSHENVPQVIVRAGKYFLCSSCGTMVEVPAEFVGQLVVVVDHSPHDKPAGEPPVAEEPSRETSSEKISSGTESPGPKSPRVKRPNPAQRKPFAGQMIDGLRVPSAGEMDRALAWVSFHLTVLDRQGSELRRLQKLIKQRSTNQPQVPCPPPRWQAKAVAMPKPNEWASCAQHRHAHEDVSMAPESDSTKERGPP